MPHLMETFRSGRHVAITHAAPGDDGYHHVNCQPDQYWIDGFRQAGFEYLEELTREARGVVPYEEMHFRRSGLIFRNRSA